MKDKKMLLEVVTPEKTELKETITSINVPTEGGSIGILYNHAPIVTLVDIGQITYKTSEKDKNLLSVCKGVLEMHDNKITILVSSAEKPEEIDVKRAREAKERAEKRLAQKQRDIDSTRAEAALKRAMMRLKTAGRE